mgnify:CR=1 FL=1
MQNNKWLEFITGNNTLLIETEREVTNELWNC